MSDKPESKLQKFIDLIDTYIWYTRGRDYDDDYSIKDEDDFSEFEKQLKELLDE